jgi:hypothetical protein
MGLTQYHHLDDSGDPGMGGSRSSSSYFALAMVQLIAREPLPELAALRDEFHLPSFEFKYQKTTTSHKNAFFSAIQAIPFRVRSVVVDKSGLDHRFVGVNGQDFIIEFIASLALRASELDISDDILVIDGTTPVFRRALRIRLSEECRKVGRRKRPFKKIISGDSYREDGLQLADMVVGAVRQHVMGIESQYYKTFEGKIVDLWRVPEAME